MSSRKLPRWIGPDGLIPDAQTIVSPGLRSCASAITSSARRVTQSSGVTSSVMGFLQLQRLSYAVCSGDAQTRQPATAGLSGNRSMISSRPGPTPMAETRAPMSSSTRST